MVALIALFMVFLFGRQMVQRFDRTVRQLEYLTVVTLSHSQILTAHDLTVRGIHPAVGGDAEQALKVYEDIQRNLEDMKDQFKNV